MFLSSIMTCPTVTWYTYKSIWVRGDGQQSSCPLPGQSWFQGKNIFCEKFASKIFLRIREGFMGNTIMRPSWNVFLYFPLWPPLGLPRSVFPYVCAFIMQVQEGWRCAKNCNLCGQDELTWEYEHITSGILWYCLLKCRLCLTLSLSWSPCHKWTCLLLVFLLTPGLSGSIFTLILTWSEGGASRIKIHIYISIRLSISHSKSSTNNIDIVESTCSSEKVTSRFGCCILTHNIFSV